MHNGLSAHSASRLLGVGNATWAAWERSSQTPSERVARRLAELISGSGYAFDLPLAAGARSHAAEASSCQSRG